MEHSVVIRSSHNQNELAPSKPTAEKDINHTAVRRTTFTPPPLSISSPSSISQAQNGLFSTSAIAQYDIILSISNPFVLLPDNEAVGKVCNYCFRQSEAEEDQSVDADGEAHAEDAVQLKKCAGCKVAVYCSRKCQGDAWRDGGHRWECKALQRVGGGHVTGTQQRMLPTPVRALVVLVMKYLAAKGRDGESAPFWGLVTNGAHWRKADRESVLLQSMAAMKYGGIEERPGRLEEVEEAWCILKTNAFRASNSTGPVGLCFEPKLAVANHSCAPVAEIGFEGRTLFMRALRDIVEGEEITISYIDETRSFEDRQEHLRTHYLFECGCPLCTEEKQLVKTEDVVD